MRNPARPASAVPYEHPEYLGSHEEVSPEMKRIGSVVLCCVGVAAIGASVASAVNSTPNPNQVAAQQCTNELHTMGVKAFKGLYGDPPKGQHAMRNCQRQHGKSAGNVVNNAAQRCRAEQADPSSIPGNTGNLTFDQFYGTNDNHRNAFGKCVSSKVQATEAQQQENLQNAAQLCRAERSDPSTIPGNTNGESFTDFYGTNKNKKNAFGKCVSGKAKAQNSAPTQV
jgi:hypothetical protein